MSDDLIGEVYADLVELDEQIQALRERVTSLEEENEHLRARLDDLDARTDLLQLVEDSDGLDAEQRSITILQHMHRKLCRTDRDRVILTKDGVEECLHYPDLDRTTFYDDMRRCERLVGDTEVCAYHGDGVGARDEAVVVLDLGSGELPAQYRASSVERGGLR